MLRSVLTVLVFLLLAVPASANTISQTFAFECLTSARACPTSEADIELTVTDGASGEVVFTLDYVGTSAFQVNGVYFEVTPLLASLLSVTNTPDVAFVIGPFGGVATVVPGGSASSWPLMVSTLGNNANRDGYLVAGEQLVIIAELAPGMQVEDIIDALLAGDFRVGVSLGDDGLATVVPEPGMLGLLGLAGLAYAGRRRIA